MGCGLRGDLVTRMNSNQVRQMAMVVAGVITIHHPFLQLPPLPDFRPEQLITPLHEGGAEIAVYAERVGGGRSVVKNIPDELLIVRNTILPGTVFRRVAIWSDQSAIWQRLEPVEPEFAHLLHHWV